MQPRRLTGGIAFLALAAVFLFDEGTPVKMRDCCVDREKFAACQNRTVPNILETEKDRGKLGQ